MSKDDSWRDTLFVWDGILVTHEHAKDDTKIPLKWEGTWVGCDNKDATKIEAPKRGAFDELVASDMHFEVKGSAETINHNGVSYYQASLVKGPGWDLKEEGEGEKNKHSDDKHTLLLENLKWSGNVDNQTANLIFACGANEYGAFVSAGWMRPGNRLTLARRYVEDDRKDFTLQELRKAVLEEVCGSSEKTRIPPWQCTVMNSEWSSSIDKKRTREDEKEDGEDKKAKES